MIEPASRLVWAELDAKLRAYVARRVRSASDVDDLVQDVLLRVQGGLAGLRDDELFGPWVYRVAKNAIADHHKHAARHPLGRADVEPEAISDPGEVEHTEALLAGYVATFVAMLPTPYREALTLTELEGLTQKAAAEMLGISLPAMKSRVQRGREQLRELFDACCNIALDARGHVVSCEPRQDGKLPNCACAPAGSQR